MNCMGGFLKFRSQPCSYRFNCTANNVPRVKAYFTFILNNVLSGPSHFFQSDRPEPPSFIVRQIMSSQDPRVRTTAVQHLVEAADAGCDIPFSVYHKIISCLIDSYDEVIGGN